MKMNTLLITMCMVATAAANLGYNYQPPRPVKQTFQTTSPLISHNGIYPIQQAPPLTSFNVQSPPIPAVAPQAVTPPQLFTQLVPPLAAPPTVHTPPPQYNRQPQQAAAIISKDIYIHSSPEETEEININQVAESVPNRKNYRIVFIKAPIQNIKFNVESLKRVQAANEEKTVIYVLAKKPDVTTIQTQLSEVQTAQKVHKPEVYFIKYKTQEEANRAQQEIQAQYDALGGSTHISDEGIAPITSVIGGGPINTGSAGIAFGSGVVNGPSLSSGTNFVASASNNQQQFAQSVSNNQQHFVQQSFQGSHAASSNTNFAIQAPSTKYLPVKKL